LEDTVPKYAQADRPIHITTPLPEDSLLLTQVHGREALCELFHFNLSAVAELGTSVPFEQLLGKKITVRIETIAESGNYRYINGICKKIAQGERTEEFTNYYLEIVPSFWMLTRKVRSRIFQQMSAKDILQQVLTGVEVEWQLQGDYKQREYCVQYQESDYNFACRLMEEEGIFWFFKHTTSSHQMVVADSPQSHPDLPYSSTVVFEEFFGHGPKDDRVFEWSKGQEIRSGKYTVWEEHHQLPGKHLDAQKTIQSSVQVGTVGHQLTAGGGSDYEIYEFPGEYSRHFDGINKGNGDQASHLQWIFTENERIAGIRMQQEAVGTLLLEGKSGLAAMTSGFTFTLDKHFSDNGKYLVTSVEHMTKQSIGVEGSDSAFDYENQITCIPFTLPYRPQRVTPVPSVRGVQLATVVGPSGEEIYVDKYSRVKVQFHWDREGQNDISSSCWMRVGTFWAGKNWGAIHIPRIGQEVIVAFEEGNVNYPIIVGSVYNADMMPPYTLPDNKSQSGVKSRSTKGGGPDNYNEIRFEDKKGSEELLIHAELDLTREVERDEKLTVGRDLTEDIGRSQRTEAQKSIEIIVGQSSIKLEPTQITIKTVKLTVETQVQTQMNSKMTNIESSGITVIKGGMVQIN
jgi:type VI secretion system secreted protein VgrG